MTEDEQELKEKIVEILKKEIEYVVVCGSSVKNVCVDHIADALIEEGIGYVRDIQAESNRYEMLYKLQNRDMVLANRKVQEYNHRAEVAEKAAKDLIAYYCDYTIQSDIDSSLSVALQQAEKELAKEGKE